MGNCDVIIKETSFICLSILHITRTIVSKLHVVFYTISIRGYVEHIYVQMD
jgi:hypothetical protein